MYLNGTKCCSVMLGCLMSFTLMAKDAKPTKFEGLQKPLCFVENKGQLYDQDNNPRNDIQFKLATAGMNLFVGNGQMHYQFKQTEGKPSDKDAKLTTYRMDVALVGANPHAKVVAGERQEFCENYLLGRNADKGFTAHSFNRVTYKEVYPGIDWVLYIKGDNVEYDFVVRPGADVSSIKLKYSGATALSITDDGSVAVETPMGSIKEKSPYAYETNTGKQVAANFKLKDNVVSFETGAYNGSLTIDPYLLWSTYFGGTSEDVATSVRISTGGNTYVGGYTASAGLATAGIYDNSFNGGAYDAFLAKYTTAGAVTFITYFGGAGADKGTCVALDPAGTSVYLAGYTNSPGTGLTTGGAYHTANNGLNDGFILKLPNTGGTPAISTWCTFFGGTGDDFINGITCDAAGNVYVTGQTASAAAISTGSAYQTGLSGTTDAFVAKFSAAGAIQWSTYFGGTSQEEGLAIACDASSNVLVTGQTSSVIGIATGTAYQPALDGTNDAFIAKFSTAGALTWGTYFGGSGTEQGNGIVCDQTTNAIAIVGNTTSPDNIAGYKAFQPAYGGGAQDGFVSYFTSAGVLSWSTYYGGTSLDYGQAICLDQLRNVVIAGGTFSSTGISSPGSLQPNIAGDYDAFLAKFTTLGQRLWATYFGGALYDYAFGVSCDNTGQIEMVGHTTSTSGIATVGAPLTAYAGGVYDGFVTKFKVDTVVRITQPFKDTVLCANTTFTLPYTVNINFQSANIFTAQLSDASGSFASPTPIGTAATGASGSISCTLPLGTLGTGYRIRIVASNPAFISPDDFYDIQVLDVLPHTAATGTTPVCVGSEIDLFDNSAYTVSGYKWYDPTGALFSITQNPVVTLSAVTTDAGTYTVVTTHNGCPNDTSSVDIVVNSVAPAAPAASASDPNCAGSTISLYSSAAGSATYGWTGPSGYTSSMQNPTIPSASASNAGIYYVTDTVGGCASPQTSVNVVVSPVTPVSISISADPGDTICGGTNVTFTATTINGGVSPSFQWMTGAASPVVGAISSTWSSSTLVDGEMVFCKFNSDIACPSPITATSNIITMNVITNSPIVHIYASPGSVVTPGTTVTFTSAVYNVGTSPAYQWQLNGANITGANSPTYVLPNVTQNDTVTLVVTSTMLCATPAYGESNTLIIHPHTVGVPDVMASLENIGLFPNPNNGSFVIKGDMQGASVSSVGIEIMNTIGQVIYTGNAPVQNDQVNKTIDLHQLPNGVYMINVSADGGSKMLRFTIQQ